MFGVDIEGKEMIWWHHMNQLRTRLTSLPFTMDSSSSELSQDPPAHTMLNTAQPLRRSTRARRPRQVWVPT